MNRTVIIAEIGECFNGDMEQAKELIAASSRAGCDYAKFQTLDKEGIAPNDPEREWFLKIALDEEQLRQLMKWCSEYGINFLCTPENVNHAALLKRLGNREVKIASTCIWDSELVDYIADNFSTVFISTGMASMEEVEEIMHTFRNHERVFLMHCVSEYPTGPLLEKQGLKALSPENVHLAMMDILMEKYPQAIVGYSDHTDGLAAPIAAVARGARVVEKHITLDRTTPIKSFQEGGTYLGTDHVLSLEPDELALMVKYIRQTEKMIGERVWERSENEKILLDFLRGRFSN